MKSYRLSLLLVILLLLSGCGLETKTFEEFCENDLNDVSKIGIVDGSTGYEVTTTDYEKIQGFIGEIKNIKFIPDDDQGKRDGFRYSITFFEDDDRTFQFSETYLNGNYYHTDPDIHPIVDGFFTTIELEEK
ncbi:hypothetical protein [Sporosarcina jiandibaonis]|uniref:hypothetical protein n=1 Tax=Sporosarcina jiandibaonis TaxID=2715535 RepID=UPI0015577AED|nr:hypothetical protein [Sporosarcina jiandibaonis]